MSKLNAIDSDMFELSDPQVQTSSLWRFAVSSILMMTKTSLGVAFNNCA